MMRSDATTELRLFPLPNVVLFPETTVPLHVFETRYRQMTNVALGGDRMIGMIAVRPEHLDAVPGDPPLFSVGCAGMIEAYDALPDGRYHIVLGATRRFRILHEVPRDATRLYRVAEVALLDDPFPASDAPAVALLRREVISHFGELVRRAALARSQEVSAPSFAGIDDVRLVNALCQMLDLPTLEKQGLLEANGVRERYERLSGLLAFRLAEHRLGTEDDEPRRH